MALICFRIFISRYKQESRTNLIFSLSRLLLIVPSQPDFCHGVQFFNNGLNCKSMTSWFSMTRKRGANHVGVARATLMVKYQRMKFTWVLPPGSILHLSRLGSFLLGTEPFFQFKSTFLLTWRFFHHLFHYFEILLSYSPALSYSSQSRPLII